MGRAFFTSAYRPAPPAVEIHVSTAESAPEKTGPQRWSDARFDPDADAFFDSEDAVYDAFLSPEEALERAQQHAAANVAEARAARFVRTPSESSASESEASDGLDSGRVSPIDAQVGGLAPIMSSSTEAVHRQPYTYSPPRDDPAMGFGAQFDRWLDSRPQSEPTSIVPVPPPGAPLDLYTQSLHIATPRTPATNSTPRSVATPHLSVAPSPSPVPVAWLSPPQAPLYIHPAARETLVHGRGPLPNASARLSRTHVAPAAIMAVPHVIG